MQELYNKSFSDFMRLCVDQDKGIIWKEPGSYVNNLIEKFQLSDSDIFDFVTTLSNFRLNRTAQIGSKIAEQQKKEGKEIEHVDWHINGIKISSAPNFQKLVEDKYPNYFNVIDPSILFLLRSKEQTMQ